MRRPFFRHIFLAMLSFSAWALSSRDSLRNSGGCSFPVGGQAVLEGVVMRNAESCALAVRLASGEILAERRPWLRIGSRQLASLRFVRGFPIMLETLINGVDLLARSAELGGDEEEKLTPGMLVSALLFALALGVGMFVVLPHFLAVFMQYMGMGQGMLDFSFHIWDGLFKFGIFFVYISIISIMPDIRRVFQYHGAEHKVIGAWEAGASVSAQTALRESRLHPRCGTTFLLFVLALAIMAHAILVPPLLWVWTPGSTAGRHILVIAFKILLMVPISSFAYELIRGTSAGEARTGLLSKIIQLPGLMLQLLTTREPNREQLEVAVVALAEALGEEYEHRFETPGYTVLE